MRHVSQQPKIDERRLEPHEWPEAVACTDGPQLVVAGPGAGKTEFLVRRMVHLLDERQAPGSSILALSFSRRAAADLRTRINLALRSPVAGVTASTFHAFAYRLLEMHGAEALGWTRLPSILTGPEQVDLVSELLRTDPVRHWPDPFRDILDTRTLAGEVTEFILRTRERLIDAPELEGMAAEVDGWRALPRFIARYDRTLARLGRIDYGALLVQALETLANPSVSRSIGGQYRYVLVDEYQDTTPAQSALLRALTERRRNLTVAADPYQSIYAFRGAELSNVERFADGFQHPGGRPARRWVLATSFRTPPEILRAAQRLTVGVRLAGRAGQVRPAPHPGRVDLHVFDQESEEAEWIASEASRLHHEQDYPYHRMAVLVRTKRRLLNELSRALERRSIPHDRPDMRLVDHPAARMIFDLALAATAPDQLAATPPIRRLLLGSLFSLRIGRLRKIERDLRLHDSSWPEVIRREVVDWEELAELLEDPSWTNRPAIDAFWIAWTRLPGFRRLVVDPDRREFRAAWASLAQTLTRVEERNPAITLVDYARLVESDEFEASPLLGYRDPTVDRMVLTTLHQSKGLEFDVVFIADAVEGVLPDLRRHHSLLRIDRLDRALPTSGNALQRRLQEETRLVYTAITRARRRVVITATGAGLDEEHRRPSRFLAAIAGDELSISPIRTGGRRPITPREAETWLRRRLADPAEPAHRRLAAATVLATTTHPGIRSPRSYAAVRRPGGGAGLVIGGRRLSPTDATTYEACPRRFALERVLRVNPAGGPYLTFGNLIHTVLERAERQAAEQDRRSSLAEALAYLEDEFPHHDLQTGAVREAWKRRATLLLRGLYADWPNPDAVAVLLEHRVEMELGGTTWRGRIDRIEADPDGTLRIVDYKSGRMTPTVREASGALQLGFYALAAAHTEEVAMHGAVDEAEFWFPLASDPRRRVMRYDPSRLQETEARLEKVARMVHREEWDPKPGTACRNCEVRLVCPAWPEGQEAYRR